ncbi:MAG: RNA polymerase sigma factor [Phycisphaerae bacterium]
MTNTTDPIRQVTDAQLLQRHLDGDPEAFTALVKRYRRPLYNFLAKFTGDRALAEDVFQEAFLQVHNSAGGFDMSRRFKPWLFTIAANKARDAMRSRSRRSAAPLDATIGGEEGGGTFADLMPGNIPEPDEFLSNSEMRANVQAVVNEMPENIRTVLVLCYFHELPYKKAAEILGIPLGTVKSRLHAAVKHFAQKWKAMAEGPDHE